MMKKAELEETTITSLNSDSEREEAILRLRSHYQTPYCDEAFRLERLGLLVICIKSESTMHVCFSPPKSGRGYIHRLYEDGLEEDNGHKTSFTLFYDGIKLWKNVFSITSKLSDEELMAREAMVKLEGGG